MADDDDTMTRDLGTLPENGPNLTAYETPSARAAYTDRPAFSPVAQPGLSPEIWWHTVADEGQIANYAPPSNGMISRLNGASQTVTVDMGNGKHKRRRRRKGKEGPQREWLEAKTGSGHPWSWLARHDKQIIIGPEGSRWRIVRD